MLISSILFRKNLINPIDGNVFTYDGLINFLIEGIHIVIFAPFIEEIIYRGIILKALKPKVGVVLSVIISSLLFAWPHIQYDLDGRIGVAIGGIFFAIIYLYSKNIFYPIIAHMLHNSLVLWNQYLTKTGTPTQIIIKNYKFNLIIVMLIIFLLGIIFLIQKRKQRKEKSLDSENLNEFSTYPKKTLLSKRKLYMNLFLSIILLIVSFVTVVNTSKTSSNFNSADIKSISITNKEVDDTEYKSALKSQSLLDIYYAYKKMDIGSQAYVDFDTKNYINVCFNLEDGSITSFWIDKNNVISFDSIPTSKNTRLIKNKNEFNYNYFKSIIDKVEADVDISRLKLDDRIRYNGVKNYSFNVKLETYIYHNLNNKEFKMDSQNVETINDLFRSYKIVKDNENKESYGYDYIELRIKDTKGNLYKTIRVDSTSRIDINDYNNFKINGFKVEEPRNRLHYRLKSIYGMHLRNNK